ncbi:hypothetical protein [Bacillus sp. JCM 19041]|uniref:hypothetical protein n=1 Tax=Bacillus sp. JCM 19041 TaxID=1460637 RepID=UPI0006D06F70
MLYAGLNPESLAVKKLDKLSRTILAFGRMKARGTAWIKLPAAVIQWNAWKKWRCCTLLGHKQKVATVKHEPILLC